MSTTRAPSLLSRVIGAAAERLAQHPSIPPENRQAFRQAAVSVIEQQVCSVIGADSVRFSGWAMAPSERAARRARIVAALQRGEAPIAIAARERVSCRWVRRVRAELTPTF